MTVYLDSSAILKLIVPEQETDELRGYLRRVGSPVSSELADVEVRRAARRRRGHDPRRLESVLDDVAFVEIRPEILRLVGRLEPAELRTLDAIHLATALELEGELEALVTYDRQMLAGARVLGLPVASPGMAPEHRLSENALPEPVDQPGGPAQGEGA